MKSKILFLFAASFALYSNAQISLNAMAGYNGALYNESPQINKTELRSTFHIGVLGEYAFTESIGLQTGLFFNGRGTSIVHNNHHDDLAIYTLDIPLLLSWRYKGIYLATGAGVGYAISGTMHAHDATGAEMENEIKFGNNPGELKPVNFHWMLRAGYEFQNNIIVYGGYLHDFTNWSNASGNSFSFPLFQAGVGYRLKL